MHDQLGLGAVAIVLGGLAGLILFVPFVAISYRRRGGLTLGRLTLWAAALVYFMAIWTYTLLSLPDPDAIRCAGANLDVWAFVGDIQGAIRRPGNALTDPGVLQLLLNVLLFVPLGFFVRVLGGRGIVVATLVGFAVSVFIETTQVTGVWTLYPCAYRVFDVDDMLTNTLGALVGSVLSLVVPRRLRGSGVLAGADDPRPVTRGRRALGMLCDTVAFGLTSLIIGVTIQLWLEFVVGAHDEVLTGDIAGTAATVLPAAVWLILVLATGRSLGDLAVQLRYGGGPAPSWLAQVLRWIGGVSGYALLTLLPEPWNLCASVFGVITLIAFFATQGGRGIPGLISGMRLADARERAKADVAGA
ncbi:VanZ family protein [Microbacterium rhizomatis]|uniref:VanZ family protein n=1 Tax=Microbacterium rhizomatis TaxID=1631477 RepID=A0A5J5IY15_9MICO|nr:VanZ family protein [Microbacterium rhizomatis]KAA9106336.1 VanZ family protein [Microbacterium rhizomatis]